jgi:predicted ArsR family transcriptional regulator
MSDDMLDPQLAQVCSLDDATRRRLYDYVATQAAPVSRDEISSALDIERSLAAYHLDKLVDAGLLTTSFARPAGRGGPGAGRPAKHYRRAATEVNVSVPARDYRLVAELLARALQADDGSAVRTAVNAAAADFGRELGADAEGDLTAVLRRRGYEPYRDGAVLRLRNCPFHMVARDHVDLVCGMNLAIMRGLVSAFSDDTGVDPALDPAPDRCCVAFVDTS